MTASRNRSLALRLGFVESLSKNNSGVCGKESVVEIDVCVTIKKRGKRKWPDDEIELGKEASGPSPSPT